MPNKGGVAATMHFSDETNAKSPAAVVQKSESVPDEFSRAHGVAEDPLPKWVKWPLDHKLPMVQGPDKVVLHTNTVGEKVGLINYNGPRSRKDNMRFSSVRLSA